MVTFIKGKPEKNLYRKFKIKISGKPDDVAMIKEVLNRRFKHSEWGFPDLILIDGGKSQFNVALKIKNKKGRIKDKIKVMSLAKKENKLYIEKRKRTFRATIAKSVNELFKLYGRNNESYVTGSSFTRG